MRNVLTFHAAAILAALSGCGGGGGGSATGGATGVGVSAPAPAPTPSPTPTSTSAAPFGALGQTASQTFVVLAYSFRAADGSFDLIPDPASVDPNASVGLRLAAPSDLLLSVGGFGEGRLNPNGASGTSATLGLTMLGYSVLGGAAYLNAAFNRDVSRLLKSTSYGGWSTLTNADPKFPNLVTSFVYGVPSPPASLPITGTAVYDSQAAAHVLTADFATRRLTGTVTLGEGADSTTYTLRDVAFASGGSAFQGRLDAPAANTAGTIEGQFTGPGGAELMAKAVVAGSNGQTAVSLWAAEKR